jgi:hypothetical protein
MIVCLKKAVCWYVPLCSMTESDWCFNRAYCLHQIRVMSKRGLGKLGYVQKHSMGEVGGDCSLTKQRRQT